MVVVVVVYLRPTLVTPWAVPHQSPLYMEFPRHEYWSGSPFPSPGDISDPGINSRSPVLQAVSCIIGKSLSTELPGKPVSSNDVKQIIV